VCPCSKPPNPRWHEIRSGIHHHSKASALVKWISAKLFYSSCINQTLKTNPVSYLGLLFKGPLAGLDSTKIA